MSPLHQPSLFLFIFLFLFLSRLRPLAPTDRPPTLLPPTLPTHAQTYACHLLSLSLLLGTLTPQPNQQKVDASTFDKIFFFQKVDASTFDKIFFFQKADASTFDKIFFFQKVDASTFDKKFRALDDGLSNQVVPNLLPTYD